MSQFIDGSLSENHTVVQASRLTFFEDEPKLLTFNSKIAQLLIDGQGAFIIGQGLL